MPWPHINTYFELTKDTLYPQLAGKLWVYIDIMISHKILFEIKNNWWKAIWYQKIVLTDSYTYASTDQNYEPPLYGRPTYFQRQMPGWKRDGHNPTIKPIIATVIGIHRPSDGVTKPYATKISPKQQDIGATLYS